MAGLQAIQKWDATSIVRSRRCLKIPLEASCIISMTRKTRNKIFSTNMLQVCGFACCEGMGPPDGTPQTLELVPEMEPSHRGWRNV